MFGFKSKDEKASLWYNQLPIKYTMIMNDSNSVPTEETKSVMMKIFNDSEISYDNKFRNIFFEVLLRKGVAKRIYFSYGIDSICEKLNELMYKLKINIKLWPFEFTKNDNENIKIRREAFEGTVSYDLNIINEYLKTQGYEIVCFVGTSKNPNGGVFADEPRFVTIVPKVN